MASTLSSFWNGHYNPEDSFLPFYCPFVFWSASYVYCQLPIKMQLQFKIGDTTTGDGPIKEKKGSGTTAVLPKKWHEWHELHNIHNMGAVIFAIISLCVNDDSIFNERVSILWNWSYFIVDLIDTSSRLDIPYTLHAICCLACGAYNYTTPLCRELRMNSKACLFETSSPFLHLAKRTKNPIHFLMFAFAFTCCRIIWIPVIISQLIKHGIEWTDLKVLICIGFYCLNLFWYSKILKIIIDAASGKDNKTKDESNNDNSNNKKTD